jgi:hypothetical protein
MMQPYPYDWPRRLDFIPPLGLQIACGEKKTLLYHCNASVSVQPTATVSIHGEEKTEFGTLRMSSSASNHVDYKFGNPEPEKEINPIPQEEIYLDITRKLTGATEVFPGGIPDIVIKTRGIVEKIPKALESETAFQGSDKLLYYQTDHGYNPHAIRQSLHIPVMNPYDFVKGKLLQKHIIESLNDPVLRRIRGILKTSWLKTDAIGYASLGPPNILKAEIELTNSRWWTDIGLPTAFPVPDGVALFGQLYHLYRREDLIVV